MPTLRFESGTVTFDAGEGTTVPAPLAWDARAARFRAPAVAYASIVLALRRDGIAYEDEARRYEELAHGARVHREPRPFQREALEAWKGAAGRGVVVLPTGAGK